MYMLIIGAIALYLIGLINNVQAPTCKLFVKDCIFIINQRTQYTLHMYMCIHMYMYIQCIHVYLVKIPYSNERGKVLIIPYCEDNVTCFELVEVLHTLAICLEGEHVGQATEDVQTSTRICNRDNRS